MKYSILKTLDNFYFKRNFTKTHVCFYLNKSKVAAYLDEPGDESMRFCKALFKMKVSPVFI